ENQVGFAGFDEYIEISQGMSLNSRYASITTEESYSGTSSLKLDLTDGKTTAAEIKNKYNFDIELGRTYKVSLKYKTDKAANLAVGTAEAGNVACGENISVSSTNSLVVGDDWQSLELLVRAENPVDFNRGYTLAIVAESEEGAIIYVDTITVSAVTEGLKAVKTENGIRFMMSYNCGGDDKLAIEGVDYTIAEHGVIVTGADNVANLTVDATGDNGVFKVSADRSKYFSRNIVTGLTVYSVLLDGVAADDTYKFKACGYVKLTNGDVYYTDYLTSSAADAEDAVEESIVLSSLIEKDSYVVYNESTNAYTFQGNRTPYAEGWDDSFFIHLPAGAVINSTANMSRVDVYNDKLSWISAATVVKNYTMSQSGYIRIEIVNGTFDDVTVSVPVESANLLYAGSKVDLYDTMYDVQMEVATKQLASLSKDAVNYIFITDIHTGAYLTSQMKAYESSAEVKLRAKRLVEQMTAVVKTANSDDNIDFIAIGGDIINGYETPDSPLYQEAKNAAEAKGETLSVREFVISQIQEVLAPLKQSEKPVFVLPGNHDDNKMQSLYYNAMGVGYSKVLAEVISDRHWNDGVIKEFVPEDVVRDSRYTDPYTGEEISKYYYYDIQKNGKTTRVVCLDIYDHRYAYDENGDITSFDTETGGIGYSVAQLQ
ncbi:MAG: metallophosphoesterase, partial [Acutalibacteraceae bacterium]|nr:metallophosphoesterase [Acutalibacteraceae bacterium]